MAPKVDVVCGHCGAAFLARASEVARGRGKHCSAACEHESLKVWRTCEACGVRFQGSSRRRFCGVQCRDVGHRAMWDRKREAVAERGAKACSVCGADKPLADFPWQLRKRAAVCKACAAADRRRRYAANPARYRAESLAYHEQHRGQRLERHRAWLAANRDRVMAYQRRYNEENRTRRRLADRARREAYPERSWQQNRRRYARMLGAPVFERVSRRAIITRDKGTCYLCGKRPDGRDLTLDHVVPLARGGHHAADNLRVACRGCNSRKGTKLLDELLE